MNPPSGGTTDVAVETAPEPGAEEQIAETSFEDQLLQLAKDEGKVNPAASTGSAPTEGATPAEDPQAEPEPEEEPETPVTPAEGKDPDEEEETEPTKDKLDKLVPLREVIEERGKKQRANERAERFEAELQTAKAQLAEAQRQLAQASGPMPTPASPLIDVQEPVVLDRLERVYEALEEIDTDNINDDGTVTVPAAIGKDGQLVYQNISPEQAKLAQKRADRVLRKDIPKRRQYLAERAQADAGASEWYPDLKQSDHQFTQLVNQITGQVLSGNAMSDPQVKFWVANAVYGFMKRKEEAQASNGNGAPNGVKKIVESAKQKVAPTAPRTRSLPERKSSAALAQKEKELEKNPTHENAEAYVAAVLSGGSGQKTVQRVAE